jgi:hypothetical protein
MNDKDIIKTALERLDTSIEAIVRVISTGRNIHGASFDLNNMLKAKANIEKLLAAVPKTVKSKKK